MLNLRRFLLRNPNRSVKQRVFVSKLALALEKLLLEVGDHDVFAFIITPEGLYLSGLLLLDCGELGELGLSLLQLIL